MMKPNLNSKIWIYQSNRIFTESENNYINELLKNFTQNWQAHGEFLKAGFEIRYNLFIILWVDETLTTASGCSIDASVRVIKQIQQEFNVDLFNRFNMAYKDKNLIKAVDKQHFEQLLQTQVVNSKTIVFNNMVNRYSLLETNWEIPFSNSWHCKVFG